MPRIRQLIIHVRTMHWFEKLFGKEEKSIDPMKYLIAGLGNMGPDYEDTRHNIGFEVVDHLAGRFDTHFEQVSYGDLAELKHKGRTFLLLKPETFMNRSGKAVRYWAQKEQVPLERLLIVVDDIHLDLGILRLRKKGSHGGHNGLKDVEEKLNTTKYPRLRCGIGKEFSRGRQVDYVLGTWTEEERRVLEEFIPRAGEAALAFGTIGIQHSMNEFNN